VLVKFHLAQYPIANKENFGACEVPKNYSGKPFAVIYWLLQRPGYRFRKSTMIWMSAVNPKMYF